MVAFPVTFDLKKRSKRDDRRIIQGATYSISLIFDSDYATDWTGFQARGQLRSDFADNASDILAEITATIIDPAARVVNFVIQAADTQAITELCGTWDAEIFNDADPVVVHRIVQGRWELNQETTRDSA